MKQNGILVCECVVENFISVLPFSLADLCPAPFHPYSKKKKEEKFIGFCDVHEVYQEFRISIFPFQATSTRWLDECNERTNEEVFHKKIQAKKMLDT